MVMVNRFGVSRFVVQLACRYRGGADHATSQSPGKATLVNVAEAVLPTDIRGRSVRARTLARPSSGQP